MLSDYFAISELDGAVARTKELLWPFNLGIWVRIAIISFFIGGSAGNFNFPGSYSTSDLPSGTPGLGLPDQNILILILVVVGVIIVLGLLFLIVGSIMEFVFVDCLTRDEVSLSRYFRPRAGKGMRLFLFKVALVVIFFLLLIVLLSLLVLPLILTTTEPEPIVFIPQVLGVIVLIMLLAIPFALVQALTTDFVVPVMISKDCYVVEGWKTVFPLLRREWQQTLVYIVVKFVLQIAVALIMFVLFLIVVLVLAIPFIFLGILFSFVLDVALLIVPLLILFIVILLPVVLLVSVPFVTFFRYYSLQVLGQLAPEHNLLA